MVKPILYCVIVMMLSFAALSLIPSCTSVAEVEPVLRFCTNCKHQNAPDPDLPFWKCVMCGRVHLISSGIRDVEPVSEPITPLP